MIRKPRSIASLKRQRRAAIRSHVRTIRDAIGERAASVSGDDAYCECCRGRVAQSMHEWISRAQVGSRLKAISLSNSLAVCGRDNSDQRCHGFLQRKEITAALCEGRLVFTARTPRAIRWLEEGRALADRREFDGASI